MYEIIFEDDAIIDLENIKKYIAEDNVSVSKKVILNIGKTIDYLELFPEMGTNIGAGYRRLVDTKYKYNIIYRINKKNIEIISIFKYKNIF